MAGLRLLQGRYADRQRPTPVPDNLNARRTGLHFAAVEPERVWPLGQFRLAAKHGSAMNIAACEPTAMTGRFLGRHRIRGFDQPGAQAAA